jgi:acyltransferase
LNKRIEWIDAAKGIGICLVVVGHALPADAMAATVIWAFHMPLFFFLSGLTAKAWCPGSAPSVARGVTSLIIPYIFFSVISIVCWTVSKGNIASGAAWQTALSQMAYGVAGPEEGMPYNVPLWFFTCLVCVRLLFYVITAAFSAKSLQIATASILALIAYLYVFPRFYSVAWNLDVAPIALMFFLAGYYLTAGAYASGTAGANEHALIALAAFITFILCVALNGRIDMNGRILGNPVLFYLGAFAGILLMVGAARRCASIALLRTLGQASIIIFPVHILFGLLPYRLFPSLTWYAYRITHSDMLAALLTAIVEIALCLPIYAAVLRWMPYLVGQANSRRRLPGNAL